MTWYRPTATDGAVTFRTKKMHFGNIAKARQVWLAYLQDKLD